MTGQSSASSPDSGDERDLRGKHSRIPIVLFAVAITFYCVYLALQGTAEAEASLCDYLDTYLDRSDLYYDQDWATAALRSIRARTGSDRAEYLGVGGKWVAWRKSAYPDRWESITEGPIDAILKLLGSK